MIIGLKPKKIMESHGIPWNPPWNPRLVGALGGAIAGGFCRPWGAADLDPDKIRGTAAEENQSLGQQPGWSCGDLKKMLKVMAKTPIVSSPPMMLRYFGFPAVFILVLFVFLMFFIFSFFWFSFDYCLFFIVSLILEFCEELFFTSWGWGSHVGTLILSIIVVRHNSQENDASIVPPSTH